MLASSIHLKIQAATLFYTAIFSQITYSYKPGDHSPNHHCHKNLKFPSFIGKGKTVSVNALKVCRGCRGIAPLIPNSALISGHLHDLVALPLRKETPLSFEYGAGWSSEMDW